jgi:hypothetical protein
MHVFIGVGYVLFFCSDYCRINKTSTCAQPKNLLDLELSLHILLLTRVTRWMPLVEHELLTLPEHLSSPQFLVGFVLSDLLCNVL